MIYSCTMFFNEGNLLKTKIYEELRGGVDEIIIVESRCTFSGCAKPLFLLNSNVQLPSQVRIIEIGEEMERVPKNDNLLITASQRDAVQRNAGIKDLDLKDDDVVICTDLDEIFPAEDIPFIVRSAREHGCVHLYQDHFCYKINLWSNQPSWSPVAATGKYLRGKTLNQIRNGHAIRIATHGKHFGYLMSPENISRKLQSFAHLNYGVPEYTDLNVINNKILNCVEPYISDTDRRRLFPIRLDNYPHSILEEIESWQSWIAPNGTMTLEEIKEVIPIIGTPEYTERDAEHAEFYRMVCDPAITFPWNRV